MATQRLNLIPFIFIFIFLLLGVPSHKARNRGYLPHDGNFIRMPQLPPTHGHHHPAFLQEELELRLVDMRRLVFDNQRLFDDQTALQRDLAAAKEELRRMNLATGDIRAGHDDTCSGGQIGHSSTRGQDGDFSMLIGPITRARAKRLKEDFGHLAKAVVEEMYQEWAKETKMPTYTNG